MRPSSHANFSNAEYLLERKPQTNPPPRLTVLRVIQEPRIARTGPGKSVCDGSYSGPFELEEMQGPSGAYPAASTCCGATMPVAVNSVVSMELSAQTGSITSSLV